MSNTNQNDASARGFVLRKMLLNQSRQHFGAFYTSAILILITVCAVVLLTALNKTAQEVDAATADTADFAVQKLILTDGLPGNASGSIDSVEILSEMMVDLEQILAPHYGEDIQFVPSLFIHDFSVSAFEGRLALARYSDYDPAKLETERFLTVIEGTFPDSELEVALSRSLAGKLDVSLGDKIRLGSVGVEVVVSGIVRPNYSHDWDLIHGHEGLRDTLTSPNAVNSALTAWALYVKLPDNARPIYAEHIELVRGFAPLPYEGDLQSAEMYISSFSGVHGGFQQFWLKHAIVVMLPVVLLFAAISGVVLLLRLRRDAATTNILQGLGFEHKSITHILTVSAAVPAVAGAVTGALLGGILGASLTTTVTLWAKTDPSAAPFPWLLILQIVLIYSLAHAVLATVIAGRQVRSSEGGNSGFEIAYHAPKRKPRLGMALSLLAVISTSALVMFPSTSWTIYPAILTIALLAAMAGIWLVSRMAESVSPTHLVLWMSNRILTADRGRVLALMVTVCLGTSLPMGMLAKQSSLEAMAETLYQLGAPEGYLTVNLPELDGEATDKVLESLNLPDPVIQYSPEFPMVAVTDSEYVQYPIDRVYGDRPSLEIALDWQIADEDWAALTTGHVLLVSPDLPLPEPSDSVAYTWTDGSSNQGTLRLPMVTPRGAVPDHVPRITQLVVLESVLNELGVPIDEYKLLYPNSADREDEVGIALLAAGLPSWLVGVEHGYEPQVAPVTYQITMYGSAGLIALLVFFVVRAFWTENYRVLRQLGDLGLSPAKRRRIFILTTAVPIIWGAAGGIVAAIGAFAASNLRSQLPLVLPWTQLGVIVLLVTASALLSAVVSSIYVTRRAD